MNPRLRLVLLGASLASVALVIVSAALAKRDDPEATVAAIAGSTSPFKGALMPRGVRAPDFELRDEEGRPISMRGLRGTPVIATFLYTSCKDTCPLEAQQIRGALDELGDVGRTIPALAIAVDPPRDTPGRARRFLLEQRATGRIRFVLGTRAQLAPVWRGFAIQPQTAETEHQARVVIIDGKGFQRVGYPGQELTPEALAHDVRVLLGES